MTLSVAELKSFTFVFNNIFCNLFNSNDKKVIDQCLFYCSFWPFYALYDYHRFLFLASQFNIYIPKRSNVFYKSDMFDLDRIAIKYNFVLSDSTRILKAKIWTFLEKNIIQ